MPAMEQQQAGKTVNVVGDAPTYDRTSMLGNLLEEYEEDSMPLLWFNGIGEFWFWLIVSTPAVTAWQLPGSLSSCVTDWLTDWLPRNRNSSSFQVHLLHSSSG